MERVTAQELGRKITSARKLRRLTQRGLAEKLNVHPSMVTRWERGQIHPRDNTLETISQALGLTVDELLASKAYQASRGNDGPPDPELHRYVELLGRMTEEDRKVVKHLIQALAFRYQVQNLDQLAI